MAGRQQWGSTAQPHCLWPQLQHSASFQDMWHFWVLQSMKSWKGKLPRATPSLKCFTTASAMLDLRMVSTSHGAAFVSMTHHQREDFTALCAEAHLWLCHYTILYLSTMCWYWRTKKCTHRQSSLQVPDSWERCQGQSGPMGPTVEI